ncbi:MULTISPECIES: prepilin peptidase [unclassified Streptomyces]|uniref:prepilin peptidase n=1 Tax=unclassified Streptomyces TaxID=2593676 RepID=UPI0036AAC90D
MGTAGPSTQELVLAAALWGAAAGALLPRAAFRFAVPAGEPWRARCARGHPMRGWLGRARCGRCAAGTERERGGVRPPAEAPAPAEAAEAQTAARTPEATGAQETASAPYSPSTGLLVTVTALACAALAAATGTRPELGVWLLLAPVWVLLAAVDVRVRRLPDPLTLPLAAAGPGLLALVALLPEHAGDWLTALYGTLALGGGYLVLFLVNPSGMGFGDVKLALGMGAVLGWYGWPVLLLGAFAGFLLGALYGGALVLARRAGRGTAIPFGPFLIAGAFAGLLIGAYAA